MQFGWFIFQIAEERNPPGIESLDFHEMASFTRQSLYELTIRDRRMAPYWLLPPGMFISLAGEA